MWEYDDDDDDDERNDNWILFRGADFLCFISMMMMMKSEMMIRFYSGRQTFCAKTEPLLSPLTRWGWSFRWWWRRWGWWWWRWRWWWWWWWCCWNIDCLLMVIMPLYMKIMSIWLIITSFSDVTWKEWWWWKQDHQRWGYSTVIHLEQTIYLARW